MRYTAEHIAFLKENITGCPFKDLTEKFNAQFGTAISRQALTSTCARYGLHNGIVQKVIRGGEAHRFNKGHKTWNKGKKGSHFSPATEFKKGSRPATWRPVGSERVNVHGYTEVKVAEPKKWELKHVLLWKAEHGPIPVGSVVLFADGDKSNLALENLMLVTRKQLVRLNKMRLIQADPELTKAGVLIADILTKCAEKSKRAL